MTDESQSDYDCLNCGMCEWCIQRSIDAAEEASKVDDPPICHCGLGEEDHKYPGAAEHDFTPME